MCPSKKVELLEQDPNYKILGKMISHDEKSSACFRLIVSSCIEIFVVLGGTKWKMEVSKLSSKCLFTYLLEVAFYKSLLLTGNAIVSSSSWHFRKKFENVDLNKNLVH